MNALQPRRGQRRGDGETREHGEHSLRPAMRLPRASGQQQEARASNEDGGEVRKERSGANTVRTRCPEGDTRREDGSDEPPGPGDLVHPRGPITGDLALAPASTEAREAAPTCGGGG